MPTASRLVAALCLVVIAFIVSGMVIQNGPEDKEYGKFTYVNMSLGFICGWVIMGKRAGRGVTAGINNNQKWVKEGFGSLRKGYAIVLEWVSSRLLVVPDEGDTVEREIHIHGE